MEGDCNISVCVREERALEYQSFYMYIVNKLVQNEYIKMMYPIIYCDKSH